MLEDQNRITDYSDGPDPTAKLHIHTQCLKLAAPSRSRAPPIAAIFSMFISRKRPYPSIYGYNKLLFCRTRGGVTPMVRDGVTNVVYQLGERGFAPRKLGHDSWESRCPGHRSSDHSLSIMRNEFNHVVLECRTAENCPHIRIIRALGFTNEHVYAETPDWLIKRLSRVEIHGAEVRTPGTRDVHEPSPAPGRYCERIGRGPAARRGTRGGS